jgi:hypothetical protein
MPLALLPVSPQVIGIRQVTKACFQKRRARDSNPQPLTGRRISNAVASHSRTLQTASIFTRQVQFRQDAVLGSQTMLKVAMKLANPAKVRNVFIHDRAKSCAGFAASHDLARREHTHTARIQHHAWEERWLSALLATEIIHSRRDSICSETSSSVVGCSQLSNVVSLELGSCRCVWLRVIGGKSVGWLRIRSQMDCQIPPRTAFMNPSMSPRLRRFVWRVTQPRFCFLLSNFLTAQAYANLVVSFSFTVPVPAFCLEYINRSIDLSLGNTS